MQAGSETKNVTRDEYVALAISYRRLVRIKLTDEPGQELVDLETNERFRITERELRYPGLVQDVPMR